MIARRNLIDDLGDQIVSQTSVLGSTIDANKMPDGDTQGEILIWDDTNKKWIMTDRATFQADLSLILKNDYYLFSSADGLTGLMEVGKAGTDRTLTVFEDKFRVEIDGSGERILSSIFAGHGAKFLGVNNGGVVQLLNNPLISPTVVNSILVSDGTNWVETLLDGSGDQVIFADSSGLLYRGTITTTDQYAKVNSSDSTANYLDNKIVAGAGISKQVLDSSGVKTLEISTNHSHLKTLIGSDYNHVITAPQANQWRGDDTAFDFAVVAGKFYEIELHLWILYTGAGSVTRSFGFGSSTQSPDVDTTITAYGTVEQPDTSSPYTVALTHGANSPYSVKNGFDANVTSGTGKYIRVKCYVKSTADKIVRLYHKSTSANTLVIKAQSRMIVHQI